MKERVRVSFSRLFDWLELVAANQKPIDEIEGELVVLLSFLAENAPGTKMSYEVLSGIAGDTESGIEEAGSLLVVHLDDVKLFYFFYADKDGKIDRIGVLDPNSPIDRLDTNQIH